MNWYDNVAGIRIYQPPPLEQKREIIKQQNLEKIAKVKQREFERKISKLLEEKSILKQEAVFYRDELYKEWDDTKNIFGGLNYTTTVIDEKDPITTDIFRTLEITPEKHMYRVIMNPEMYDYLRRDAKLNQEYINHLLNKTIVSVRKELKNKIIYALEK